MQQLATNEVHIWKIDLDAASSEKIAALFATLSSEEQNRAGRFVTQELKNRFVVAHGILREILAPYIASTPKAIVFSHNAYGKPALTSSEIHFNLSHSHHLAYVAVAHHPVGIDVEYTNRLPDFLEIAKRFFAEEEYAEVLAAKEAEQKLCFFRIWTRKEAFIKALGKGLSQNLKSFVVSVAAEDENFLKSLSSEVASSPFFIRSFPTPANFVGAVAASPEFVVKIFTYR